MRFYLKDIKGFKLDNAVYKKFKDDLYYIIKLEDRDKKLLKKLEIERYGLVSEISNSSKSLAFWLYNPEDKNLDIFYKSIEEDIVRSNLNIKLEKLKVEEYIFLVAFLQYYI